MKISKFLLPVLVFAGLVVYLSLFTVKEINQAIVLQFGDPKKVIKHCKRFGCTNWLTEELETCRLVSSNVSLSQRR